MLVIFNDVVLLLGKFDMLFVRLDMLVWIKSFELLAFSNFNWVKLGLRLGFRLGLRFELRLEFRVELRFELRFLA